MQKIPRFEQKILSKTLKYSLGNEQTQQRFQRHYSRQDLTYPCERLIFS